MPRIKRVKVEDRRASRRIPASEIVPHAVTKLSTGQEVKLINVSIHGAIMVQSSVVLAPGSYVRLKLAIPGSLIALDGRVQRCRVIALKQGKVKYEAGIALYDGLPQELAERLQFMREENQHDDAVSMADLNSDAMLMSDTAELWIMRGPEV